jgi:hypothetical protein
MAISDSQRQFGEKNRLRSDFEANDCGTVALCLDLPCTQQVPAGLSSQSSMTLRSLKYQHLSELKGSIGRLDVQCLSGNVSSPCRCSSSHVSVFSSRSYRGRDSWAGKYQSGVHTALGSIQMEAQYPGLRSRWVFPALQGISGGAFRGHGTGSDRRLFRKASVRNVAAKTHCAKKGRVENLQVAFLEAQASSTYPDQLDWPSLCKCMKH